MAEEWLSADKSFIITGGANSLGAAYVEAFLKEGAKKIAILDIDEEAGNALSLKLNGIYGNKTIFVKCDVGKEEDIARAFDDVLKEFKQIDVIINNAGVMNDSENIWRKACDINWQGVVSFTRKGISHMRKDEGGAGGTIVNVSSIAGFLKLSVIPAYAGSKAAVLHFGFSLSDARLYEKSGVRILTICLGPTQTTLLTGLVERCTDKEIATEIAKVPITEYQKVESAVAVMVTMFRVGTNGSVWLSSRDRPAEEITHVFNNTEKQLADIVTNGLNPTEEKKPTLF